jgi:ribonuclease P protein component
VVRDSPQSFSFPRSCRLRRRGEFLAVRGGESYVDGPLAANWRARGAVPQQPAPGMTGHLARVGITVSSKVGDAVVRNRVKRRLREAVRHEMRGFPAVDLVLTARPSAARAGVAQFRAFLRLARSRMSGGSR